MSWCTAGGRVGEKISRGFLAQCQRLATDVCIRGTQPAAAIYPAWYVYARTHRQRKRNTYVWHAHSQELWTRGIVVRSRVSKWPAGCREARLTERSNTVENLSAVGHGEREISERGEVCIIFVDG